MRLPHPPVVDFHTHIFPPEVRQQRARFLERDPTFAQLYRNPKARIATAEELIAAMDGAGVAAAVALNLAWADPGLCRYTNDYLLEAAQRYPGRILPFCMIPPLAPDQALAEVERCLQRGARGIGELRPDDQGLDLADVSTWRALAELAKAHSAVLLLHASEPVGHSYPGKGALTPDRLYPLVQVLAHTPIVLAHWGGGLPFYALMPEVAAALRHVSVDTAATPFLYRWRIVELLCDFWGPEHLLFGSDFPLLSYERYLQPLADLPLPVHIKQAILSDNARRLLGLLPAERTTASASPLDHGRA
jgi:predicted TIM-barrel fold metal-dependent hydrolase